MKQEQNRTPNELIRLVQLPIIEEQLHALKERWEQMALDAKSMVCTDETIQAVKAFRADMRKEFDEVEALRKQVKQAVLGPYQRFETVYRDCVTHPFNEADSACSSKISAVEWDKKKRCEDSLRDYFAELCAVRHLDWLTYERAGIKVDMASAKAKTPKKLREQLAAFVMQVGDSVDRIIELDDAEEIMVEFRRTLDAAGAICTVQERHRRIEEERAANESRKATMEREAEAVHRVEALAPPVAEKPQKNPNDIIPKCTFTAYDAPRWVLQEIKTIFERNGIRYE